MKDGWQDEVLAFWFGELTEKDWFAGGDELDGKIKDRLEPLTEEQQAGKRK